MRLLTSGKITKSRPRRKHKIGPSNMLNNEIHEDNLYNHVKISTNILIITKIIIYEYNIKKIKYIFY
jgi:hypothetical protein